MATRAYVFDVEGTLVDSVDSTLRCWRKTLLASGHDISLEALQTLSGMDGKDMLGKLLPGRSESERTRLLKEQGQRFENEYLEAIKPFADAHETLRLLKERGFRLALATDCKGAAL